MSRQGSVKGGSTQDEDDIRMPDLDDPTSMDAEWKKIQQNTFTRWCNEHLKKVNLFIYNLETDFSDGLKLIALMQNLAHKKIARYNRKPTFRPQKLENIAIALQFIESEQIKLVNIDAGDILKGNIKLILGLIWTLILKYQISLPMMDDDDDDGGEGGTKMTPKQALMGWVKSKLPPEIQVRNFSTDWNDGIAVASLVDATAPGLFPEWEDLVPANKLENAKEAMQRAEDWLGVPQVITPEEITNPNVDELSVMTYVSYFPEAKVKPGAPLKQKMTDASKCSAHGPGLEERGVVVNMPAEFTVVTTGSSRGKLSVQVFGPRREPIDCAMQDNHDNTYTCQYTALKVGMHDVHIRVGGHHIPKSPFRVSVASDLDSTKVSAEGPGLEPNGVIIGRSAKFKVITAGAGVGDLVIDVIDPKGNKKTELKVTDNGNGTYDCAYMPVLLGRYVIIVKYGGSEVGTSPYQVNVSSPASRVKIYGDGLEPGLKTGKPATFIIDCCEAGDGDLDVSIEAPGRGDIKTEVVDNGNGTFTCTYKPTRQGLYTISVKFDHAVVPRSPVKVTIGSTVDISKIKAWGPGLSAGVVSKPAEFFISCKGTSLDNLCVRIDGPEEIGVEKEEQEDGSVKCWYIARRPGNYTIHIMYDEMDINESPFTAEISPKADIDKVYAEGPGLTAEAMAQKHCEFTIYAQKAGAHGKCRVTCYDENGDEVESKVKDNGNHTYSCYYVPKKQGKHKVVIFYQGDEIPQSPITVDVQPYCDHTKVKATGAGLTGGKMEKPSTFHIDASKAGDGNLGLTIEGPSEADIKYNDHGNGICDVEYIAVEEGEYSINILYADQHIPGSPFKPVISSTFDASKVKASGLGLEPNACKAGKPCPISIDARKAGKAKLGIEVCDDVGEPVKVELTEQEPGIYNTAYHPTKDGPHTINITYGGKAIPKSPFKVTVKPAGDASKVKCSGPGLEPEKVTIAEETFFEVDTTKAGEGNIDIHIESTSKRGPKVKNMKIKEGKVHGTYIVYYTLPELGEYTITITFSGVHVPQSPFKIRPQMKRDPSKVKVSGKGLEHAYVKQVNSFTIDTHEAGAGNLGLTIEGPEEAKIDCKENGDGTATVEYVPYKAGTYDINVTFDDVHVPGSPFKADAIVPVDASKVKCSGDCLSRPTPASFPTDFVVDTCEAGEAPLEVDIVGPGKKKYPCEVKDNGEGVYTCAFVPERAGKYQVTPKYGGTVVPGAPLNVTAKPVGDASKVKVTGPGITRPHVHHPAPFAIDATTAGDGNLNLAAKGPKGDSIPIKVVEEDGIFACEYTPTELGPHELEILFGGEPVRGSPFKANAEPEPQLNKIKTPVLEEVLMSVCKEQELEAPIDCSNVPGNEGAIMTGRITTPSGKKSDCDVKDNHDGTFALNYTPTEVGKYILEVCYDGIPIPGSPFEFEVTEGGPDKVKVYGKGIKKGIVAIPSRFTVDTKNAGPGDLSVAVEGPSKVDIDCLDNGDGTCEVTYVPIEPGEYEVIVKFDNKQVPGSPFKPKVLQDEPAVETHIPSDLCMSPEELCPDDIPKLKGILQAPSGKETPVEVSEGLNDSIIASFQPEEPGKNLLHLKKGNKPIKGSPVPIMVRDKPLIGKTSSIPLECIDCQLPQDVPQMKAILTRPNGKDELIHVEEAPDQTIAVSFTPEEPGKHLIKVFKNNKQIDDSPFVVMVEGDPDYYPKVGKPCDKNYHQPEQVTKSDTRKMSARLRRPTGKEETVDVELGEDHTIAVSFVPTEAGEHLVFVKKDDRHVPNSPFSIMVIDEPQVPTVGSECAANFDIPELKDLTAKQLKELEGTLERPNGKTEPLQLEFLPDKSLAVHFIPQEAGPHKVSIKRHHKHVKDSPFVIMVEEAKPLGPTVGHDVNANLEIPDIDLPRDLKNMKGVLERPNGKKEDVKLGVGPDGKSLAIQFVPNEPGKHQVHVTKRGRPCKDSPYIIMVEDETPSDETTGPVVGRECGVNLDIPELTNMPHDLKDVNAKLTRPTGKKEPLECKAGPDGTLAVGFTPTEPGTHLIDVLRKNKPVKNSPFEVKVGPSVDQKPGAQRPGDHRPGDHKPGDHKPGDQKPGSQKPGSQKRRPVIEDDMVSPVETGDVQSAPDFPDGEFPDGAPPAGGPAVGTPCDVNLDIDGFNPSDIDKMNAELTRPCGDKEPVDVSLAPSGGISIGFIPTEPGKHLLDVKKGTRPVKGSPFVIDVAEATGPVSKPTVGNKCGVDFDIADVKLPEDLKFLKAKVTRPSGIQEEIKCQCSPENTLGLEFVPKEPGKHLIDVTKRDDVTKKDKPVKGSPFTVDVEADEPSANRPTVGNKCGVDFDIPDVKLPEDLKFLKAKVTRPSGIQEEIKCQCSPENTLGLEFVPKEPGKHVIDVTKKDKPVKGSPFTVEVEVEEPSANRPTVGNECDVHLELPDLKPRDFHHLKGTLKRPGAKEEEKIELKQNPDESISVCFIPREPGVHEVSIKKFTKHVTGSPFEINVDQAPGAAKMPVVGAPCDLTLDMVLSEHDMRYLTGELLRPNATKEEPLDLKLDNAGHLVISFVPKQEGKHEIRIKRNGKHVPGSPIEVMVGIGEKKPGCDVGFVIPGIRLPDDLKYLKGSILAPCGTEEPVDLHLGPNNKTVLVSFLPKEVGKHLINIKKHGRHVGDSPFEVIVKPEDIEPTKADASKVKCYGSGLTRGEPNTCCEFTVDTREAGYGGLGLSVEGPSKVEINCVDNEDGTCSIDYMPAEPGSYLINVTYADVHVPGSPFKCRIGDQSLIEDDVIVCGTVEDVHAAADDAFSDMLAFPSSKTRSPQDFVIKFSGSGDLNATVTRPSGTEDEAEVVETGPDTYTVRFVPRETGEHLVNVKSRRRHIPGSPFKVLVEAPAGGAAACRADGSGLECGVAGQQCRFTVITRDAGPGGLAVAVEGPAKAEIQCHDNGDGSCDITWFPVEAGEYTVHIRFADEAIPGSPYKVMIKPADEGKAMSMECFKEQLLRIGQQASFAVQMKGKKGKISAKVTSPSSTYIECTAQQLEEGNYAIRFIPKELGDHLVNVYLDGHDIPGSPFTVKVAGLEGDPSKVIAYGPGLKRGVEGRSAEFTVNALDAGSGALALSIDGPAKVKMNCVEQDDGTYKVIYSPTVRGDYEISIRFAGQHIPSSAYKVHITGPSEFDDGGQGNASKCCVTKPPGKTAQKGKMNSVTVDTAGAGRGMIMVGVEGPWHDANSPIVPAKEIVVKHMGGSVYSVNYLLEEKGAYVLHILWGGNHIPGSPFDITV